MTTLIWRARIQSILALSTGVRQLAHALVIVHQIDASAAVFARVDGAVVHVGFAVDTRVARQALARVRSEVIVTNAAVLTRIGRAFVDVDFALLSAVSVKLNL